MRMVRWIEDNNNIGNILKFSGYSRLFSSRDKTTEDDIVSIIGVKSETIDVFILLKIGKFSNIPGDTLFIQSYDFRRLVSDNYYSEGVFYKGNFSILDNYCVFEILDEYDLISAELLRFIEDTKEYIRNNWRKENENKEN